MDGKRMAGAIVGGLVAGLGITAMLMAGETKTGEPSELALLERASAHRLGVDVPPDTHLPNAAEQAVIQGGHLLLSAAAGAVFAAMHWITGPLLGVKKPEWQANASTIAMYTLNHVAFGLATALGAKAASRL